MFNRRKEVLIGVLLLLMHAMNVAAAEQKKRPPSRAPTPQDVWLVEEARVYFRCAAARMQWTEADLMNTMAVLVPDMHRIGFTHHQAQAFVVKTGYAATGAGKSLKEMTEAMRIVLEDTHNQASQSIRSNLDASYRKYCPSGPGQK